MVSILVTGSRGWPETLKSLVAMHGVLREVAKQYGETRVVQGGARGADYMAWVAAQGLGLEVVTFPALWGREGRSAGVRRNQRMLDVAKPALVLAFHDDLQHSKGTGHMVDIALRAGLPVFLYTTAGGQPQRLKRPPYQDGLVVT